VLAHAEEGEKDDDGGRGGEQSLGAFGVSLDRRFFGIVEVERQAGGLNGGEGQTGGSKGFLRGILTGRESFAAIGSPSSFSMPVWPRTMSFWTGDPWLCRLRTASI
jgi:hypothetical protein